MIEYFGDCLSLDKKSSASSKDLDSPEYIGESGEPHPAIALALPYLNIEDLLSVEIVCKSLHEEVRSNNLLWRNISILNPLNKRIGDKSLLNLAAKSQGLMESLTLFMCPWITNDSLKIMLSDNPKLKKLCVMHCPEITVDDMLDNLRTSKLGLKLLRVNGLIFNSPTDCMTAKLEELQLLVSPKDGTNPKFYNPEKPFVPSLGRPIDIEQCIICLKATTVYEILPKSSREEFFSLPCGVCGNCTRCTRLGLVCYACVCDDCYGKRGPDDKFASPKFVSSTCSVVTLQLSK